MLEATINWVVLLAPTPFVRFSAFIQKSVKLPGLLQWAFIGQKLIEYTLYCPWFPLQFDVSHGPSVLRSPIYIVKSLEYFILKAFSLRYIHKANICSIPSLNRMGIAGSTDTSHYSVAKLSRFIRVWRVKLYEFGTQYACSDRPSEPLASLIFGLSQWFYIRGEFIFSSQFAYRLSR